MRRMAWDITDERHTDSTFSIGTASNALRRKFKIDWIHLNSKSNELACSSTCSSQPVPIEANRTTPTEVESCLLFCSLFPTDFRLPIEDLVTYGMALKLFGDVYNISEGRCRIYGLVKNINHQLPPLYVNKLSVWGDKYGGQYVKVLSSAKDLAKSIASKYRLVLGGNEIVAEEWPYINRYEHFYGLSHVREINDEHTMTLGCPHLALVHLQHREDSQTILVDIFGGIKGFMIQSLDAQSLTEALNMLCNLRTLRLSIRKLQDMSWIGHLINLEFLSISTSSLTDIPKEMGQLGNLRLLDMRKMSIAYIPPGVLSRMLKLEELYFPSSFQRWGCWAKEIGECVLSEDQDDYDDKVTVSASNNQINRINASISEITSLSLHALEISIPNASVLPENSSIFKNIRQFKVFVPNNHRYKPPGKFYSTNVLQLKGDAYDINASGICNLMSGTQDLSLMKVRNLKNIRPQLQDQGFPKLQKMIISECDELEYIVDTTTKRTLPEDGCLFSNLETLHLSMLPDLKEIWHGRSASLQCFNNLSQISIRFCHKLKYVFPLSIVRGSIHLKSIQILDCIEMDGIFYQDTEDDQDPVLYSIEELHLHSLPKIVGFLVHVDDKISGVHNDTEQSQTTNEILSSNMEGSSCTADINFPSFSNTEKTSRAHENCITDEEVICPPPISIRRENAEKNVSHQLVSSQLAPSTMNKDVAGCTEKYVAFISSKYAEKWMQDLKRLEIMFCDSLQIIFLFEENHFIAREALNSLIELKLYGLQNLEHVWFQVPPEIIAFRNLQLLVLSECHNFYLFSPGVAKLLVQLRKIYINRCANMEEVIGKENEEDSEDKVAFPCLQFLEFEHNPNLKCFYSGIHAVELPLLECVKFNQCNKMKYFSYKPSRTPVLKRIQLNESLCALTGDLNTTIKRYILLTSYGTPSELHRTPDNLDGSNELDASNGPYSTSVDNSNMLNSTPRYDYKFNDYDEIDSTTTVDISASEANKDANRSYMKEFTFADLKTATNNFSSDALLGKGGFGNVYKGWLDERTFSPSKTHRGMPVAIKKMDPNANQGFDEWQGEVCILERLWHPNLIKLLGYCREDEELLIVYEFMKKGSLDDHLFGRNLQIEYLSWELRLKIAIGAAQGLECLHTLEKKVVYRDVKASNILLDGNFNAKLSDFGLAKFWPSGGDSHVTTGYDVTEYLGTGGDSHVSTKVIGTNGYIAPEYFATGCLYVKSDVYGFGVVLLELMTGLKAIDKSRPSGQHNLVEWLKPVLLKKRKLKKVMDRRIEGQYSSKAMMLAAQLCSKCILSDHKSRPSMKEVVEVLQQIHAIKENPKGSKSASSSNSTMSHCNQQ